MFCPKCGTESSEDSQFCRKCGTPSVGAAPQPAAAASTRNTYKVRLTFVLVLLLMIVLFAWSVDHNIQSRRANLPASAPDSPSILQPQLRTMNIGNGSLSVAAHHFVFYTLPVPTDAHGIRVQGHFQATGGTGNDIEVLLLNEEQFTNFKNGHGTPTYYNSGKVTVGDIQAPLPDGAGTYYLIFNNNFSLLTPKAIQFTGTLVFEGD